MVRHINFIINIQGVISEDAHHNREYLLMLAPILVVIKDHGIYVTQQGN